MPLSSYRDEFDEAIASLSGTGSQESLTPRMKGPGFLGTLQRPGGGISTELSVGVNLEGKETEIPTLVPTLEQSEIDYLLGGGKPTDTIIGKAVEHARMRISEGKSSFAQVKPKVPRVSSGDEFDEAIASLSAEPQEGLVFRQQPMPEAERGFLGDVASHTARGLVSLAEHGAQGLKTITGGAAGGDMSEYLRELPKTTPFLRPDVSEGEGEGIIKRGGMGAIESAPMTGAVFAGAAGGAKLGALVTVPFPAAVPAGTIIGGFLGAGATMLGLFGAGTYGKRKDEATKELSETKPELSNEQISEMAHTNAMSHAKAEILGEGVGDFAAYLIFSRVPGGKIAYKGGKAVLKDLVAPNATKIIAKGIAKDMPFEVGSEVWTAYVQHKADEKIGIERGTALENMGEAIIPAMFLSGGMGVGLGGYNAYQRKSVYNTINSKNLEERVDAINLVSEQIARTTGEEGVAQKWHKVAMRYVEDSQDVPVDTGFSEFIAEEESHKKGTKFEIIEGGKTEAILDRFRKGSTEDLVSLRQSPEGAEYAKELDRVIGEKQVEPVYDAAKKRVGLFTPTEQAEREYQEYQPDWQVVKEGEGIAVMAKPEERGLIPREEAGPKALPPGQGFDLLPPKPKTKLRPSPEKIKGPAYPEGAEYVVGKKAPEELDIEHKPILTIKEKPFKKKENALRSLKSKRLASKGITPETHEVVSVKGGFGITKKVAKPTIKKPAKSKLDLTKRYVKEIGEKIGEGELDKVKEKYPQEWERLDKKEKYKKNLWDKLPKDFRENRGINEYTTEELEKIAIKEVSKKVKAETPTMLKESDKVNDVTLGTLVDMAAEDPAKALEHAAEATVSKAKLIEGLKNKGLKAMGEAKTKEERAEIKRNLEETLRGIEEGEPTGAIEKTKWYRGMAPGKLNYGEAPIGNQLPFGVHFTKEKAIAHDFATGETKGKPIAKKGQIVEAKISAKNPLDIRKGLYYEGSVEYDILKEIAEKSKMQSAIVIKYEGKNAIDPNSVFWKTGKQAKISVLKNVLKKYGYDEAILYSMKGTKDPLGIGAPIYTDAIAVLSEKLVKPEAEKPKEPIVEALAKEPWEMSQDEILATVNDPINKTLKDRLANIQWALGVTSRGKQPGKKLILSAKRQKIKALEKQIAEKESRHKASIKKALKSGKLTPEKYAKLHEKDYGPLAEFMPEVKPEVKEQPSFREPEAPYVSEPFLYSALTRAAESKKFPEKLFAKSVINQLKKAPGVKQAEIDTVGLVEWLEGKERVSRAELVEFLRMNEVTVEESEKGITKSKNPAEWKKYLVDNMYLSKKDVDAMTDNEIVGVAAEEMEAGNIPKKDFAPTKFAEHVLPGGEPGTYRELVLGVPSKYRETSKEYDAFVVKIKEKYDEGNPYDARDQGLLSKKEKTELEALEKKFWGIEQVDYKSTHWDEPNVIAHIRGDTRIDADGKKRFHIAEFQSDIYSRIVELESAKDSEEWTKELANLKKLFPWGENWHELVSKKALEYAIRNDFDGISWDTAKTQVDRWESALRKSVDKIGWDRFVKGKVQIVASKNGKQVLGETVPLQGETTIEGQKVTLNNLIGKELATKIRESSETSGSFEGKDLTIGGEFYKIIYDQKIPGFLKKYGKKWGATVRDKTVDVKTGYEDINLRYREGLISEHERERELEKLDLAPISVHAMDITPTMRQSIQTQGQAVMEPTGKYRQSELDLAFGGKKKADEAIESVAKEVDRVSRRRVPDRVAGEPTKSKIAEEMRKNKRVDLTGRKLTTGNESQEIAELFQVYRSPKMEILHAIYTSKDGIILGHNALTSGNVGVVNPGDRAKYVYRMQSAAKRLGAAKVHILHNHPSGDATMSREDLGFANGVRKKLGGLYGEFVVIDHGKFTWVSKYGREGGRDYAYTTEGTYKVTPGTGKWMERKGPLLKSPQAVAVFGNSLAYDKTKACFVYVDGGNNVVGWSTHDNKILEKSVPSLEKILRQQTKGHGAAKAIIIAEDMALLEPIAEYGNVENWLLDALALPAYAEGKSLREAVPDAFRIVREPTKPAWGLFEPKAEYGKEHPTLTPGAQKLLGELEELKKEHKPSLLLPEGVESHGFGETLEPVTTEDYIANRKESKDIKLIARTSARRGVSEMTEGVDKFLGSISTRLGQVSPKLKAKIRKLDFDINTKYADDVKVIHPLLKKAKKMSSTDFADWDYARKNSDIERISELIDKYNLRKEYKTYREVLDNLRNEGLDVGLAVGQIDEYAPRLLKDSRGFLTAIGKAEEWPIYSRQLQERANELGVSVAEMPSDMKADIISNMILGGWSGLGGIPATKQRKLKKIPAYLNKYYMDSDAALMQHLYSMRKGIEARKFFGEIPKKVTEIRTRLYATQAKIREINKLLAAKPTEEETAKLKKRRNKFIGLEKQYTAYVAKYALQRDYTENIGSYVMELINNKEISPQHERVVSEILNARFHEAGTRGLIQAYKNLSYIDTMGSPISALTQGGDLAWAIFVGGFVRAGKHAFKAAIGRSRITKEDVGVTRIAQEFADSGTLGKAVTNVFKIVGLEKIDSIGKESLLNSTLEVYQKQAKNNPAKLKKKIRPIFEAETDSVIEDLVNNEISENVKFLVYNRLLDFQPVGLSEMPQKYLDAGNGRLFYMLKTFTIKVFDVFRNEAYYKIKKGDRAEKIQGIKNLVRLSMIFVLCNAGADELKDWVLGRKTDLSDRAVDNVLRLFGISKFVTWKARTEGVGSALARQILPPFKFIDSAGKDIITAGDEKGLEMLGSIPVVGKLAYWHIGRGVSKRGDLWDRRLRKRKAKLNKIKNRYEKTKNKTGFIQKHRKELGELRAINKLQGQLNKYRSRINRLKSIAETPKRKKVIQNLENKRTELIKTFLKRTEKREN